MDSGSWQPGSSNMVRENSTPGWSGPVRVGMSLKSESESVSPFVALIAMKLQ